MVPLHYNLDLTPDLDKLSFTGSAMADIDVNEPVDRLILNAVDLAIQNAAIDGEPCRPPRSLDAAAETVTSRSPHRSAPAVTSFPSHIPAASTGSAAACSWWTTRQRRAASA